MRFLTLLGLAGCTPHLYSANGAVLPWVAPENSWPLTPPPEGLVAEGFGVGQVVPDARLTDQHSDTVSLWQFSGQVFVLDVSTMWCAPCQDLALGAPETAEDFAVHNFSYITVLLQNVESQPPSVVDLGTWAETFEINSPVLADPDGAATGGAIQQNQYPAVLIVGRDLRVIERVNPPSDSALRVAVERAIAKD